MSSDLAISVKNVSKAYTIWKDPTARLKHPLLKLAGEMFPPLRERIDKKLEGLCSDFHALRDVSFEVKKGESVGIIGRNGSGKSTLLQIIAGTLQPSEGSVTVNGRVAALLELGSGFNPEFTGRENVYLNASILGLTREETEERFADITAFADIGEFIDQPVKTYSSGMVVRLSFAVQAMVAPDILIIDEALAVGDYFFQQKCARRMRELREKGTTLLFVSHDLGSVRDLCQKALYLQEGAAAYWGASEKAINYYLNEKLPSEKVPLDSEKIATKGNQFQLSNDTELQKYLDQLRSQAVWWLEEGKRSKHGEALILGVIICNEHGDLLRKIKIGQKLSIRILFLSQIKKNYYLSVTFKNRYDQIINVTTSYLSGDKYIEMTPGSIVEFKFCFDLNIEAGKYSYKIILAEENKLCNTGTPIDETPWMGPLEINWNYEHQKAPFFGMFGIPVTVSEIGKWEYK